MLHHPSCMPPWENNWKGNTKKKIQNAAIAFNKCINVIKPKLPRYWQNNNTTGKRMQTDDD